MSELALIVISRNDPDKMKLLKGVNPAKTDRMSNIVIAGYNNSTPAAVDDSATSTRIISRILRMVSRLNVKVDLHASYAGWFLQCLQEDWLYKSRTIAR